MQEYTLSNRKQKTALSFLGGNLLPNIYDVAKVAGVSFKTVSRVINGETSVTEATRRRVDLAIEQLGYTPDANARGLAVGRRFALGLVIPDVASAALSLLVEGMEYASQSAGYDLVLRSTRSDRTIECELARQLMRSRRIDGLAILSDRLDTDIFTELEAEGVPMVVIGRQLSHLDVPQVFPDNRAGMYSAVQHLAELGHRQIAYISCVLDTSTSLERLEGFESAMADLGLEFDSKAFPEGMDHVAIGYQGMNSLLARPVRPTGVCTFNDLIALGALRAIRQAGLRVPHDMALVGFDDIQAAEFADPGLTTVHQQLREMGTIAARMLIGAIEGHDTPLTKVCLSTELVVRESSTARALLRPI